MKIYFWIGILAVVSNAVCPACRGSELYEQFRDPPAEAKPFVRWWWNGSRVTEDEIEREIELMRDAGLGGFEINPIAQPPHSVGADEIDQLEWLSPEWCRMVEQSAEMARKRGMIPDIIVGSGWPFGASFLEKDQMTQYLGVETIDLQAGKKQRIPVQKIMDNVASEYNNIWNDIPPELMFAFLAPANPDSIADCEDVTELVSDDGVLTLDVPSGRYKLHLVLRQRGFSSVTHGTLGADGPVLDHYNADAVESYLNRMSGALNPVFDGKFGEKIRAVFCDSIELTGANWSGNFANEFRKRRGYDLTPWLPYASDFSAAPMQDKEFEAAVKRVRYDYCKTLTELFQERFIQTYNKWCHANGALSRYQAYGLPYLMGLLDSYLIPDIPESNNWLFHRDPYEQGCAVWSKYASSAGNMMGQKVVSSEAMTNLRGVFTTTLEDIKIADDMNFIMGINHSVLHGFNYSPPQAGFPGWMRYGSYFSEHNTWWRHLPLWTEYNARISAAFQATEAVAQVAILAPRADVWSAHGLKRNPFQTEPWYAQRLWEPISQCGATADYISETVLQKARFEDGKIFFGETSYDALVLTGVESMEPASAEAVARYAATKGNIAFVGERPARSPGYLNAEDDDRSVREAIEKAANNSPDTVFEVAPCKKRDPQTFAAWTDNLLDKLEIERSVAFESRDPQIYQVQRVSPSHDLFFFVNRSKEERKLVATLNSDRDNVWLWDPESGKRTLLSKADSEPALEMRMQPSESLLIVCDDKEGDLGERRIAGRQGSKIEGDWTAKFRPHTGEEFVRDDFELMDLGATSENDLNTFAGTVEYEKEFEVEQAARFDWLDLGEVHGVSEVILNGESLGKRWYGRHVCPLNGQLRKGANTVKVKVTTTLFNYAKSLENNQAARRWVQNRDEKEPAGLVGPVRLIR